MTGIIGLIIILAGVFLVFSQTGLFNLFSEVLAFWPIVVSIIGMVRLIRGQGQKLINILMIPTGFFLAFVGFFSGFRETLPFAWGVLLMLLGLAMIINKNSKNTTNSAEIDEGQKAYTFEFDNDPESLDSKWSELTKDEAWDFNDSDTKQEEKESVFEKPKKKVKQMINKGKQFNPSNQGWVSGEVPEGTYDKNKKSIFVDNISYTNVNSDKLRGFKVNKDDKIDKSYIFSTEKGIYNSNHFIGGRVSSVFSDAWLDLSRVEPHMQDVRLNVNVFFSTLNIRVPNNWVIYMSGNTFFGDSNIPTETAKDPKYRLFIDNNVTFGSLNVEYRK